MSIQDDHEHEFEYRCPRTGTRASTTVEWTGQEFCIYKMSTDTYQDEEFSDAETLSDIGADRLLEVGFPPSAVEASRVLISGVKKVVGPYDDRHDWNRWWFNWVTDKELLEEIERRGLEFQSRVGA